MPAEAGAGRGRTGVFYSVTYLGFALPLLLTMLGPGRESTMIFVALAALAAVSAISRAVRLRRDAHRQQSLPA